MPRRFFLSTPVSPGEVVLEPAVAEHIARSLRMRQGDSVVVVDAEGREHGLRLRDVAPGRVSAESVWSRAATGEPQLRVTVLQALPSERMEDCIDALVEVGAASIHPVITEHVIGRPPGDRLARRVQRWQAIAVQAAQLAGRGMVPVVHAPAPLQVALQSLPQHCRLIACVFDGATALTGLDVDPQRPLTVCIGPEGGFGPRDLQVLVEAGAETAHLGARVLRTRYAGAIACACLLARAGDLDQPFAPEPVP